MRLFTEEEFKKVNIYVGLTIKFKRLKLGLSQFQLAVNVGSNNTSIGRIERAEHFSGWDKIITITQFLDIDFCELMVIKDKKEILKLVNDCYILEEKLTSQKENYYVELLEKISKYF
ncbi:MAG: helix-turn-helix transcriptional regulator [Flavobacteriaceae bacterium]|jgi:transcriptional regulator with XRE-family HTH domain|nr:helix-turn-helix transcriptional regulator [Flavobacteriaceae bacterium]